MYTQHPSERGALNNVSFTSTTNDAEVLLYGNVQMPIHPSADYLRHGVILDHAVVADPCVTCPLRGTVWQKNHKLKDAQGKIIPAQCTRWYLPHSTTGNVILEHGDPYHSKRRLDLNAILKLPSRILRDSAIVAIAGKEALRQIVDMNSWKPFNVPHDSPIPCARGGSVEVRTEQNPPNYFLLD
jgi:hypothetical protein